jgi:hypothetical protein
MNQDQERIHDAYAPVHIPPLVPRAVRRGAYGFGWVWRCHRADHGGEGEHHGTDRSWAGRQAAGAVRLRFGVPCGPDCTYLD